MLFYYDNNGKLVTVTPHGEIPRQCGSLKLYIVMDKNFGNGTDGSGFANRMMTARFKTQGTLTFSEDYIFTKEGLWEFEKLPGESIGSLVDGKEYFLFSVDLTNTNANKVPGDLELSFTLYANDNQGNLLSTQTLALGKAVIYVENTLGLAPYSGVGMTYTEYQSLLAQINDYQDDIYDLEQGKEDKSNKVTEWDLPTDTQYPSAKLVKDSLDTKALITETGNKIQLVVNTEACTVKAVLYDKNNNIIVTNLPTLSIIIIPFQVENKIETSRKLANLLNSNEDEIYNKINKKTSMVRLNKEGRRISIDLAKKIEKENLDGVYIVQDNLRYYPYDTLLSQSLGFVGSDNQGLAGIENYYENVLKGQNGSMDILVDAKGGLFGNYLNKINTPVQGMTLRLTINLELQKSLERELYNNYLN